MIQVIMCQDEKEVDLRICKSNNYAEVLFDCKIERTLWLNKHKNSQNTNKTLFNLRYKDMEHDIQDKPGKEKF